MDRARGTEMIKTRNASLADFLPSPGICAGRPSFAELTAHLSDCLGIPVDDLELVFRSRTRIRSRSTSPAITRRQ